MYINLLTKNLFNSSATANSELRNLIGSLQKCEDINTTTRLSALATEFNVKYLFVNAQATGSSSIAGGRSFKSMNMES